MIFFLSILQLCTTPLASTPQPRSDLDLKNSRKVKSKLLLSFTHIPCVKKASLNTYLFVQHFNSNSSSQLRHIPILTSFSFKMHSTVWTNLTSYGGLAFRLEPNLSLLTSVAHFQSSKCKHRIIIFLLLPWSKFLIYKGS